MAIATTREGIDAAARELGADLVGFASSARMDSRVPPAERPSRISTDLRTIVVLGMRLGPGIMGARDLTLRQFAAGNVHYRLERATRLLAYRLEENYQALAAIVPALLVNFGTKSAGTNAPAGQAALFLRLAAVEAGLGTLGLNQMLLTPRFGPRVVLGAVMTDLDLPCDEPLVDDLCLGLEACGRCAAICPEQAIPLRAPEHAPLAAVRGLDEPACLRASQPYGPDAFVEHVKRVFLAPTQAERIRQARGRTSALMFHHMLVARQATYTGCMACEQVCPVGDDYSTLQRSPDRQADLPDGVEHERADGWVTVRWVGPPVPYRPDYDA
jgi:epoxyqueuosine reductase